MELLDGEQNNEERYAYKYQQQKMVFLSPGLFPKYRSRALKLIPHGCPSSHCVSTAIVLSGERVPGRVCKMSSWKVHATRGGVPPVHRAPGTVGFFQVY